MYYFIQTKKIINQHLSNTCLCYVFWFLVSIGMLLFYDTNYSEAAPSPVSPEEMESTFRNIDRDPTNHQTFARRVQVLDEWRAVLARSGRRFDVERVLPPGWISDIMRLKNSGKAKEAFAELDWLYREIRKIETPQKEPFHPNSPEYRTSQDDNRNEELIAGKKTDPIGADILIDFSKAFGTFSPYLFGAISAPYFDQTGFDLAKEAGFKLIGVFLDSSKPLPAHIDDPAEYDFSLLDKQVEAIFEIGAEPMIIFAPLRRPLDLNRYAGYVRNVAKHLTRGWGDGHRWKVKLFRFGNEPDNTEFWKDTQFAFFETYAKWAKTLKDVDPAFILVAPGLMQVQVGLQSHSLHPWVNDFLNYCHQKQVPLDYFSFHAYSPIPYHFFYENARLLKSELQKYPRLSPLYGAPKIANDEWQIKLGDLWSGTKSPQFDTAWAAAHNIDALINMIEQGIELSLPMTGTFNGGQGGCHDFLLVGCNNQKKPSFYAFKGFNWLYGTDRLSVSGTDQMNFAAIAGKTEKGMIVVFSNHDVGGYLEKYESRSGPSAWREYKHHILARGIPNRYNRFSIKAIHLPWKPSDAVVYAHYLVDDTHGLALVETKTVSGNDSLVFEGKMDSPSVHVVQIHLQ
ncbi:GH39 family glycosyl hydrolase [Desulfatirhabdium butyrativorans]|uniref:GH39 family glycosyl hydrolase n=1 Tax=Desulfatirhabdium butyrativorans TaxID=340467 RepID=UPI0004801CD7|nr:hypothetical protein [Desulfatirhabdium butyrativorans]